jgi:hypothetical protein
MRSNGLRHPTNPTMTFLIKIDGVTVVTVGPKRD